MHPSRKCLGVRTVHYKPCKIYLILTPGEREETNWPNRLIYPPIAKCLIFHGNFSFQRSTAAQNVMAATHFGVLLHHKLEAITFKCLWFLKYDPENTFPSIYCGMFYHGTVKERDCFHAQMNLQAPYLLTSIFWGNGPSF